MSVRDDRSATDPTVTPGAESVLEAAFPPPVSADPPTDALARASLELLAEYRTAAKARADVERELDAHLGPVAATLERTLSDAITDEYGAVYDLHVAELARHLPGLAPTIRLLWAHVIDCRFENVGLCCAPDRPVEP